MTGVGSYANISFEAFPPGARETSLDALSIAAEGGMAAVAKPIPKHEIDLVRERLKRLKEMLR